jgi:hypothetical protein
MMDPAVWNRLLWLPTQKEEYTPISCNDFSLYGLTSQVVEPMIYTWVDSSFFALTPKVEPYIFGQCVKMLPNLA